MGSPLPWFPLYVDRFETDEKVRRLTISQQGVFFRLLCWQWREGSVPNDPAFVAAELKATTTDAQRVLNTLFSPAHGSRRRRVNQTLDECYQQALGKSEKARRAGLISATKRAARAEQFPNGPGADVERSRSRIRTQIDKSLSAPADGKSTSPGSSPDDRSTR